jgi:rsbT antagonist protein RsbS
VIFGAGWKRLSVCSGSTSLRSRLEKMSATLAVPILRQGDILIVTVQGDLGDAEWAKLTDDLLDRVAERRTRYAVLDLSVVDVLDSFACRTIVGLTRMVSLRGPTMIVAGIRPSVAFAMVQLGALLPGVATALDLDHAMALMAHG